MSGAPDAASPVAPGAGRLGPLALALLVATALCVAVTLWLFERAYPLVDAGARLTREAAVARARAVARAEGLAPPGARPAARFQSDEELATYVDLAAGGPEAVRRLAGGGPVPLYAWDVRLFEPGSPREALVRLGADGRLVGVRRTLAESDRRPTVSEAAGRGAAEAALARVSGVPVTTAPAGAGWRFVAASFETQPRSGRVDRTYRFERVGVRVGEAPVRADVTVTGRATRAAVAGAVPTDSAATDASAAELLAVRTYAEVPESWRRRYDEMRASNDLYASLALPGLLAFAAAAVIALAGARRAGHVVRWRPAVLVGALVGAFLLAATLNGLPLAWFDYDTATAPRTFVLQQLLGALAAGVATVVFVTLTVAAAELLTRRAFPWQVDWFAFVRRREHPAVGAQVLGGYALAAFGFAYVTLFYLGARRILGWWVPTGSLDDPNLVATPLPWAGAIGMALFAGVWEEAVFRAVPLAALSLWVGDRPGRRWWMGAGVVATALVFGFGHANYPSWPAYSRGVELFLEAALWAVLYLRVGLPVTIVAHVLYDLVWFGLFAAHGEGAAYRTTLAVVVAAGALPALLVAHGAWRRRALRRRGGAIAPAPRLGDRTPPPLPSSGALAAAPTATPWTSAGAEPPGARMPIEAVRLAPALRWVAWGSVGAAIGLALVAPVRPTHGPAFTAPRARVAAVADSALRAAGLDPSVDRASGEWSRTLVVEGAQVPGALRRFLRESTRSRAEAAALLAGLAGSHAVGPAWEARYVRRRAPLGVRGEEWQVRVAPDGRVRGVTHVLPEAAPGDSLTRERARSLAAAALGARGSDPGALREVEVTLVPRPRRIDATVEYEDPRVRLPGGATARVGVSLAGAEVVAVRRWVELPEAFERRDRERQSRRLLVTAVGVLVAGALAMALLWRAMGRVPADERGAATSATARWWPTARLGARGAVLVGVIAALGALVGAAFDVEAALAGWPTAQPWGVYLTSTLVTGLIPPAMLGLAVGGGWALGDALRRRVGVPWVPADAAGRWEALLAGAALGAVPAAAGTLVALVAPASWRPIPETALDAALPWLSLAPGALLAGVLWPLLAIPALVLAGAVRGTRAQGGVIVLLALALAPVAEEVGRPFVVSAAGMVGGALLAAGVAWAFGRGSVLAWVMAGLVGFALDGLRGAVVAVRAGQTTPDVVAPVVASAVAGVVLALVWRAVREPVGSSGAPVGRQAG